MYLNVAVRWLLVAIGLESTQQLIENWDADRRSSGGRIEGT